MIRTRGVSNAGAQNANNDFQTDKAFGETMKGRIRVYASSLVAKRRTFQKPLTTKEAHKGKMAPSSQLQRVVRHLRRPSCCCLHSPSRPSPSSPVCRRSIRDDLRLERNRPVMSGKKKNSRAPTSTPPCSTIAPAAGNQGSYRGCCGSDTAARAAHAWSANEDMCSWKGVNV